MHISLTQISEGVCPL